MGSEAITQNDLKNVLDAVLPVKPSEYKKLLWTNQSPTSAFAEQTINLDLSDFDAVEVVYKLYISQQYDVTGQLTYMSDQTVTVAASGTAGFFSGTDAPMARTSSMSSNGVHFSAGSLCGGSSSWSVNNNVLIPYKIYGIKYERIAPPQLGVVPLQVATFQKNTSFVAGAGSVVFDTPLPEGAIIKSRCISQNPNAQWLYCGIHTVSATSTTVAYRNNFSSAFSGTMELSVFYEIAN